MSQYSDLVKATTGVAQYWRLDETSGTSAANQIGGGETGTYVGSPTLNAAGLLAANDPDAAFTTNGSTYMKVDTHTPVATSSTASFSLEAWVSGSSLAANTFLLGEASGSSNNPVAYIAIDQTTAGKFRAFMRNDANTSTSVSSSLTYNDSKPHHVVMTADGALMRLYVDAIFVGFASTPSGALTATRLGIGGLYRATFGSGTTATIDEVATYTATLSAATITAHYNTGRAAGAMLAA